MQMPHCKTCLKDEAVEKVGRAIVEWPAKGLEQLAAEMERYEAWLLSDGLRLIEKGLHLGRPVRPVRGKTAPSFEWRPLGLPRPEGRKSISISTLLRSLRNQAYAFSESSKGPDAVYLPALNQVWAFESTSPQEKARVLGHEFLHASLAYSQPAMLFPLRNRLMGLKTPPTEETFQDIAESTVMTLVPVLEGQVPSEDCFPIKKKDVHKLGVGYLALARKLARLSAVGSQERVPEALRAIAILMMHVVPRIPGQGAYVLRFLRRCRLMSPWIDKWDLFLQLHSGLANIWRDESRARECFYLMPPVDVHRLVGDMVIFLSGALNTAAQRPAQLVGAIPAMLGILTFGIFQVMPIVTLSRSIRGLRARIAVVHSTSRSKSRIEAMAALQDRHFQRSLAEGRRCEARALITEVWELVLPFIKSSDRARVPLCLRGLLRFFPERAAALSNTPLACEGCQATLRMHDVICALRHISLMPKRHRKAFMRAAECYENWLRTECVNEILSLAGYNVVLRTAKAYKYL